MRMPRALGNLFSTPDSSRARAMASDVAREQVRPSGSRAPDR
ncbi:Uncharacterised protein [Mycobacteroides abscessus subsp. abscessus]|nr:Uncharacterised protein [Mycobacteroides abscessus subsp. abscessus]